MTDAKKLDDAKVLLGLFLPPLGRRHDEEAGIDGAHTGQHVAKKADVAGDVHEADAGTRREHGVSKPEIDSKSACFLLGPSVGVNSRKCTYERGFAVVDVTGGGDDPTFRAVLFRHHNPKLMARIAARTTSSSAGSTVRRSIHVAPSWPRAMIGTDHPRSASTYEPEMRTPYEAIWVLGIVPPPGVDEHSAART